MTEEKLLCSAINQDFAVLCNFERSIAYLDYSLKLEEYNFAEIKISMATLCCLQRYTRHA